jgi:hypothetical protein
MCPSCQQQLPAEAFYPERGAASGVTFYRARCQCGQPVRLARRPGPVTAW